MMSSSVTPLTEYRVLTKCGRELTWSAFDLEHLMRDLIYKGFRATHVQTMEEYEAEQVAERMRQLEQVTAVRLVERARKGRRQGA